MLQGEERVKAPVGYWTIRCNNPDYTAGFLHLPVTVGAVLSARTLLVSHMTPPTVTVGGYDARVIDLHTHSSFSDGSDTPEELARKAASLGITAIALTDHDTTASHNEMAAACAQYGIELVRGVEISLRDTEHMRTGPNGQSTPTGVHVLAYFLPLEAESPIQLLLKQLRDEREIRNRKLVTLLQDQGFDRLTLDDVVSHAGSLYSVGRPHFATVMFEQHPEIVGVRNDENWGRLFVDWLGNDGRAYIPKSDMTIEQFVAAGAGTSTFFSIAHPLVNYLPYRTDNEVDQLMPAIAASLRERGFRGIEAHYGGTSAETRALMIKLTRDAGMIPTGGSDYHGSFKTNVQLGSGRSGDLRVPESVLEEMKAAVA
jgi:hypothetical protein